jgi:transcriptional regulator with XRE-family HTH domain
MHSMVTRDESASTPALARLIGQRVRAGRTELGWTLDQLASRSGVSRRMLVNVEQGTTNPSIATLLHLSDALGIGLPALVDTGDDATAPAVVHRAGELSPMWIGAAGGAAVMVAGTTTPDVIELWDWRLGPGETYPSEAHRAGTRELLLVLTGGVDLLVGDTEHRLRAGDSAGFDASLPHTYRNASATRGARFTLAVFEPDLAGPSHPRTP